jgi:hypothetical protein
MGDVQVNVPVIHIKADSGTKLELVGFTPKSLAGTINSASAENITVIWSKKPQP